MKVLHFSVTPLAGSPIRIVRGLNKTGAAEARLVTLNPDAYGARTFAEDLVWGRDSEEIFSLMDESDIFHFHHWFDFRQNPFGFDFSPYERRGVRFVRQIHSHPGHGQFHGFSIREVVMTDTPQLVIAQYPERYFPRARLVMQAIDLDDPLHQPTGRIDAPAPKTIFYSPSNKLPAFPGCLPQDRWATKGYPEVAAMLGSITAKRTDCVAEIVTDTPHSECLRRKREAWVAIDDLVTGSYHLSGLESLAQGVPTLGWLDARTQDIARSVTGSSDLPWINCPLRDAPFFLNELLQDDRLRAEIGNESRLWMERNWSLRTVSDHFRRAYEDILHDPTTFNKPRFDPESIIGQWKATRRLDLTWQSMSRASFLENEPAAESIRRMQLMLEESRTEYAKLKAWTDELQLAKDWLESQYKTFNASQTP